MPQPVLNIYCSIVDRSFIFLMTSPNFISLRSCLNLVLQILNKPKVAIHTDDKVIATQGTML